MACAGGRTPRSGLQWWPAALFIPLLAAGIALVIVPKHREPINPYSLHDKSTDQLLQQLPERLDDSFIGNELMERLIAGSLSQENVDEAVQILASHMPALGPERWPSARGCQTNFLIAATHAHLISTPALLELCDALFGPRPIVQLPRWREGKHGPWLMIEYGGHWNSMIEAALGVKLVWHVDRVLLDGKPIKIHDAHKLDYRWFATYSGTLPAGDHLLTADVQCAYIDSGKLIGMDVDNLQPVRWPDARKRWRKTISGSLKVYKAGESIVALVTDPAKDPEDRGVRIKRLVVEADGDGKKKGKKKIVLKVSLEVPAATSFALSYDAAIAVRGQTKPITLGPLCVAHMDGGMVTRGDEVTGTLGELDPTIRYADVILTPNAEHVEYLPNVAEIWGKTVVFRDIPLERLDLEVEREPAKPAGAGISTFQVRLASGVTVELLGVGENKKDGACWLPDGRPQKRGSEFDQPGTSGVSPERGFAVREFIIRLGNLPSEPVTSQFAFVPEIPGIGSSSGASPTSPIRFALATKVPPYPQPATVRFGLAAGIRPMEWVEFRNVSLQPGQTTDVQVVVPQSDTAIPEP